MRVRRLPCWGRDPGRGPERHAATPAARLRRCRGLGGSLALGLLLSVFCCGALPAPARGGERVPGLLEMEMNYADQLVERGWFTFAADQLDRLLKGKSLVQEKLGRGAVARVNLRLARLHRRRARDDSAMSTEERIAAYRDSLAQFQRALEDLPSEESFTTVTMDSYEARRELGALIGKWADEATDPKLRVERLAEAEKTFQQVADDYDSVAKKMTEAVVVLEGVPMRSEDRDRARAQLENVQATAEFERARSRYLASKIYKEQDPAENTRRTEALQEAIKEADKFANSWPDSESFGLLLKGMALCDLKKYSEAAAALEPMTKEPAEAYVAHIQRAGLFWAAAAAFELKKFDAVIKIGADFLEWYPESQEDPAALELMLLVAQARAELAVVKRNANQPWREDWDRAIGMVAGLRSKPSVVRDRADILYSQWVRQIEPRSFEEAASAAYGILLQPDPSLSADARKGIFLESLKLYRLAILLAQTSAQPVAADGLATAWFNIARLYFFLGRKSEAAIAFEQCARLTPPSDLQVERYRYRSKMLYDLNQETGKPLFRTLYEQAVQDELKASSEMYSGIADVQFRSAVIAEGQGKFQEAIDLYAQVKPTSEYYAKALHNSGRCYIRLGYSVLGEAERKPDTVKITVEGDVPLGGVFAADPKRQALSGGKVSYQGDVRSRADFAWWAMRAGKAVTVQEPADLVAKMNKFAEASRRAVELLQKFLDFAKVNPPTEEKALRDLQGLESSAIYLMASACLEPPFSEPQKVVELLSGYAETYKDTSQYLANAASLLTRAHVQLRRPEEAAKAIEQLEQAQPTVQQLATAYRLVSTLLLQLADEARKQNKSTEAEALTTQAVPLLKKLLVTDPNQPFRFYANLFTQFFQDHDYGAAAQIGETLLERFPPEGPNKDELAPIRERIGVAYCNAGDCEKGVALLKERSDFYEAIEEPSPRQRSDKWFVNKSLADCYARCNQLDQAIDYYAKVREGVAPGSTAFWDVYLALCETCLKRERYADVRAVVNALRFQVPAAPKADAQRYVAFLEKFAKQAPAELKDEIDGLLKDAKDHLATLGGS